MTPTPITREAIAVVATLLFATPAFAQSTAVFCPAGFHSGKVGDTVTCIKNELFESRNPPDPSANTWGPVYVPRYSCREGLVLVPGTYWCAKELESAQ